MSDWAKIPAHTNGCRGKGRSWRHTSGWEYHHCGGHSPLWPYYLVDPATGLQVFSHNGRGFRTGEVCRQLIGEILAGEIAPTARGCAAGILRLPTRTSGGETVEAR